MPLSYPIDINPFLNLTQTIVLSPSQRHIMWWYWELVHCSADSGKRKMHSCRLLIRRFHAKGLSLGARGLLFKATHAMTSSFCILGVSTAALLLETTLWTFLQVHRSKHLEFLWNSSESLTTQITIKNLHHWVKRRASHSLLSIEVAPIGWCRASHRQLGRTIGNGEENL